MSFDASMLPNRIYRFVTAWALLSVSLVALAVPSAPRPSVPVERTAVVNSDSFEVANCSDNPQIFCANRRLDGNERGIDFGDTCSTSCQFRDPSVLFMMCAADPYFIAPQSIVSQLSTEFGFAMPRK